MLSERGHSLTQNVFWAAQQGLIAHTTLALTPEHVPLGLLHQQVWARDPEVRHQQNHKNRPLPRRKARSGS
jgi:hypothetical protein